MHHLRLPPGILACFYFLFLTMLCVESRPASDTIKTNVIIIFVDDQGYYDLSCYGATEVNTPHIDALAAEGARFTDYYAAAPICSPSRAGLLTGCYPDRIGMASWVQRADSNIGIHPDERTLAELFHANGYRTACIGKWHIGGKAPFQPLQQGFEHYFGLLHNLDPVELIYFDENGPPITRNGKIVKKKADPAELTSLYTDEAIDFITKNKDEPFFIYLPHTMLHNPLGVSEAFKGSSQWGEYGDAIQELDHHVGRITDTLKTLKLDKNTIIVYASDNGRGPGRNNKQPIRGRKQSTYEGGIRVPCILWGPGQEIKQQVSSDVVSALDLFPTLATFAGIKVPNDRIIDGRDISSLLKQKLNNISDIYKIKTLNSDLNDMRPFNPSREWASLFTKEEYHSAFFYYGSHGSLAAVRSGPWKLHLNPSTTLYNLEKDPGEQKPLHGPVIKKLKGMAVMFSEEMRQYGRPVGQAKHQDL